MLLRPCAAISRPSSSTVSTTSFRSRYAVSAQPTRSNPIHRLMLNHPVFRCCLAASARGGHAVDRGHSAGRRARVGQGSPHHPGRTFALLAVYCLAAAARIQAMSCSCLCACYSLSRRAASGWLARASTRCTELGRSRFDPQLRLSLPKAHVCCRTARDPRHDSEPAQQRDAGRHDSRRSPCQGERSVSDSLSSTISFIPISC